MKPFKWSEKKNKWLKERRGFGFHDIEGALNSGGLLDTIDNPNKSKYSNQKVFIIKYENYAYRVPFVEDEEKIFFKTAFPSRKATKKYLKNKV